MMPMPLIALSFRLTINKLIINMAPILHWQDHVLDFSTGMTLYIAGTW